MPDKESEDGAAALTGADGGIKQHGLFGSAGLELTEPELVSPATTKFLRHLNTSQELEISKLRSYETQYYDKRQECEVLRKEKELIEKDLKSKKELENLQKVMITVGGIILGMLKLLEGQAWYISVVLATLAILLIVGGMFPVLKIGAAK